MQNDTPMDGTSLSSQHQFGEAARLGPGRPQPTGPSILTPPSPIAREEYVLRRQKAAASAAEAGLGALLVFSEGGSTLDSFGDVFYLTNHYAVEPKSPDVPGQWRGFGRCALLLSADGTAILMTGPPNWRHDLVEVDEVRCGRDLYGQCIGAVRDMGLSHERIGLVREQLVPLPLFHLLRETFPDASLVRGDAILEGLRIMKSDAEVEWMCHASAVGATALSEMLKCVAPGQTDGELAIAGFAAATRLGATPYDFAMSSGPDCGHAYWSRLPTFDPHRVYRRGDLVHPDVFGCVSGYFYDLQRSAVVGGSPEPSQLEVLEGAIAAVHHVCDQLRPGRRGCDAYAAGVEFMQAHRWLENSGSETDLASFPAFGHGIGLGWEGPWLTATDETEFRPGMTIAVETFCSKPNGGTAVFEEAVLVTAGEPEIMTASCPAQWWA